MKRERYEEHVIYSYTRIYWSYENENTGFSMQILWDKYNWPKYYYVIKIKNEWELDFNCESWHSWAGILENYTYYVEQICSLISLIYWKTFIYLWIFKNYWGYNILDFSQNNLKYDFLPWDIQENRIDIEEDINLVTLWPLIEWLVKQIKEDKKIDKFLYIVSFYHKGIVNSQFDVEIAYIDFVRSIEILNNVFYNNDFNWEDIYEWKLLEIWNKIKDNEDLARYFKEINWSTRKFLDTILDNLMIDDLYNTKSTCNDFSFKALDTYEKIKKSIKNIYAIRSWYIHAWESFWSVILPDEKDLNELIYSDISWSSNLKIGVTLTLLWLERMVRHVLLNYYKKLRESD